ncbi:chitin synthase-domain-containing protein [Lactarius sanguifluus]|nr:chitin synthase-domain-containing protein [Lactarius sanguifluus]
MSPSVIMLLSHGPKCVGIIFLEELLGHLGHKRNTYCHKLPWDRAPQPEPSICPQKPMSPTNSKMSRVATTPIIATSSIPVALPLQLCDRLCRASELLNPCAYKDEREFTHMRYLTVTGYPDNVEDNNSMLRQLFIVMTMYNEDDTLFARTMHGVMKNIAYLCKRDRSKTWGKEGWKKVVVCIVSDGCQKTNSRTLSAIAAIAAYQEGIATNLVNRKSVSAHIYECTTQIAVTESNKIEGAEKGIVPVQIVFCLKEKNQKKINSHRWFFNAFGPILQPNVTSAFFSMSE